MKINLYLDRSISISIARSRSRSLDLDLDRSISISQSLDLNLSILISQSRSIFHLLFSLFLPLSLLACTHVGAKGRGGKFLPPPLPSLSLSLSRVHAREILIARRDSILSFPSFSLAKKFSITSHHSLSVLRWKFPMRGGLHSLSSFSSSLFHFFLFWSLSFPWPLPLLLSPTISLYLSLSHDRNFIIKRSVRRGTVTNWDSEVIENTRSRVKINTKLTNFKNKSQSEGYNGE